MHDLTLSFDNGPTPAVTETVLDALEKAGVLSTFFIIGEKLRDPRSMALATRAKAAGHWIGNHSFTHSAPLGTLPGDAAVQEIAMAEEIIGDLAQPRRLFRPPGESGELKRGLLSRNAIAYLRREGYTCVLWNCVPRDWESPDGWVQHALDECFRRPWALMVLHDLPTGAMRHLPEFLAAAASAGVQFRQDFPTDCVPISDGNLVRSVDRYLPLSEAPS